MSYEFEKNKLYAYLGEDLVDLFKKYQLIIAGGTITSLLTNSDINDIDVYARNEEDAIKFIEEVWKSQIYIVSNTKKALQFFYKDKKTYKEINVQLIHFKYFTSPQDIFGTFDYTACMGAFDFKDEEFHLHNDFLKHNSQRILKFNSDTAFPIVSMLRVQKYEGKGYKISKPEFIRVILTCMNLNVNTYEELKDQLGGMYGINYDKLFEDIDDEEFNLTTAINKIANIALDDDYFKEPVRIEFDNLEDITDTIRKTKFDYIEYVGTYYRIDGNKLRKTKVIEHGNKVDGTEFFDGFKIYKFVVKKGDQYSSNYESSFKYHIGEVVVAKSDGWMDGQLYFSYKEHIKDTNLSSRRDTVLIEATMKPEDFTYSDGKVILTKKAYIVREVPELEWKEWEKSI